MAPPRPLKRQKTNPDQQLPTTPQPAEVPLPPDSPAREEIPQSSAQNNPRLVGRVADSKTSSNSTQQSWYQSWPRKAAPVTQVARDSITKATDAATETASVISDKISERRVSTRSPSLAMTLGKTKSNRSLPIDAMTTKVNATSEMPSPSRKSSVQVQRPEKKEGDTTTVSNPEEQTKTRVSEDCDTKQNKGGDTGKAAKQNDINQPQGQDSAAWFPWLSKDLKTSDVPSEGRRATPTNKAPKVSTNADGGPTKAQPVPLEPEAASKPLEQPPQNEAPPSNKRNWLQMWTEDDSSKKDGQTDTKKAAVPNAVNTPEPAHNLKIPIPQTPKKTSQASSIETSPPPQLPGDANKSSGWVFWSREKKGVPAPTTEEPHQGELAISGTPSQNRPKRASISLAKGERPGEATLTSKDFKTNVLPKTGSVKPVEAARPGTSTSINKEQDVKSTKAESVNAVATAKEPETKKDSPAPSIRTIDNLLLPEFTKTLRLHENPSIIQQLARLLYYTKEPELKHLSLIRDPPRIRNALAIGVHGYFPGAMVRTFLGQPTGTSIKFADMAAKSIRKWTRSRGYDCQVKTAALEGEGKIAERVDLLWKLLLNWIEEIRKTDFVLVACHSQGVPVAIMLVAKLIQFGCISGTKVGICAMAGVNMGPFAEYNTRWISGSAGELFEFSNPDSRVSADYVAALETLLRAGARITLVGSIDDQLVSLESSIFSPITHPHIYRAVLIDSRIHAPNFLSHLVGFVMKLRNLGVQDHGLIRELSSPLAGSLYSGEGHSRIYEDETVYDLAVTFALETTTLPNVSLTRRQGPSTGSNPYILPFAMRGILEEDFVKSELQTEAHELLREFDEWKPTTKVLKDVKFRLEGVRSRL